MCIRDSQEEVAQRLFSSVSQFCAASGGPLPVLGRGRAKLTQTLQHIRSSYDMTVVSTQSTVAEEVDPARAALPQRAGQLPLSRVLCPERAAVARDLNRLVIEDQESLGPVPRACHAVPVALEAQWVDLLIERDMGILIPESEIPRDARGRLLLAGWFGVPHSEGRQRLIFDRRPQNLSEGQLDWLRLPHGSQLTRLVVAPHETIRGWGDDLSNWFYQLRHDDSWIPRNAAGRRLRGSDFLHRGATAGVNYRFALRVVAMGDQNGPALAQMANEDIISSEGGLRQHETMRLGRRVPDGSTWQGVYIDDHRVIQRLPRTRLACRPGAHASKCSACQVDGGAASGRRALRAGDGSV